MKEIKGELWDYWSHDNIICITTNGTVKKSGECVMGRGCAAEAVERIPGISRYLGNKITRLGNHVHIITDKPLPVVVSFPVKHNWWEKADLELIRRSVGELMSLWHNGWDHKPLIIPRPGCSNGRLQWEQVKPLFAHLPNDVWVISK